MVFDYCTLNNITIPDANPLPVLNEALDQVAGEKIFSEIDLIEAYHQMRVAEHNTPKNAIRIRFGFEAEGVMLWAYLCTSCLHQIIGNHS